MVDVEVVEALALTGVCVCDRVGVDDPAAPKQPDMGPTLPQPLLGMLDEGVLVEGKEGRRIRGLVIRKGEGGNTNPSVPKLPLNPGNCPDNCLSLNNAAMALATSGAAVGSGFAFAFAFAVAETSEVPPINVNSVEKRIVIVCKPIRLISEKRK